MSFLANMLPLNPQENRFAAVMRRDPKHAEELDNKLQENLVQKNPFASGF